MSFPIADECDDDKIFDGVLNLIFRNFSTVASFKVDVESNEEALEHYRFNQHYDWDDNCPGDILCPCSFSCCPINFTYIDNTGWFVRDPWEIVLKTTILAAIVAVGLLCNLSIIWVILRNKILLVQATNLFLLNMAISDFLNLLINPVLYLFQQNIILRFYEVGHLLCNFTPLAMVSLMLTSVLTLTIITLNRFFGIVFPDSRTLRLSRRKVYLVLTLIWITALLTASPTIIFKRYWERYFLDVAEKNCDDIDSYQRGKEIYWMILLVFLVWIPTLSMIFCYGCIFYKLRVTSSKFPYFSEQSRIMRSRRKVNNMLVVLLIVQILSWMPWQVFTILDMSKKYDDESDYVQKGFDDILFQVKYYCVFLASALNPFLYGFGNEMMRKAFKLTFPCFFRSKAEYVLTISNIGDRFVVIFKDLPKLRSGSTVEKQIYSAGLTAAVPVCVNFKRKEDTPKTFLGKFAQMLTRGNHVNNSGFKKSARGGQLHRSNSDGLIIERSDTGFSSIHDNVDVNLTVQAKSKAWKQTSLHISGREPLAALEMKKHSSQHKQIPEEKDSGASLSYDEE